MTDAVLRWGILSTANIGRGSVIPAIRASRNGRVAAVASRDAARATAFAAETGIPMALGSYQALLADPEIDAVYIPLPNNLHREWAIRAAERGKHILCEKPLALTRADCLEMEAAARANGVQLMEAFMYRFHPRTERVVALVRSGAVGELKTIRSTFTFRLTRPDNIRLRPELGGGAVMDVGCYCINASRTIAGAEPETVQAWAEWTESGVDQRLLGTLFFPGDVTAQFDCALSLERREWYEVAGTEATLRIPAAFVPGTGEAAIEHHRGRAPVEQEIIAGANQYQLMVEHFADCVHAGTAPRYPVAEAAANLAVIEALLRSARSGGAMTAVA